MVIVDYTWFLGAADAFMEIYSKTRAVYLVRGIPTVESLYGRAHLLPVRRPVRVDKSRFRRRNPCLSDIVAASVPRLGLVQCGDVPIGESVWIGGAERKTWRLGKEENLRQ